MRPPRMLAYAATAAYRAAGACVPAAEETQEIPLGGTGLNAHIRTYVGECSKESFGARHRNALRNGWETLPR